MRAQRLAASNFPKIDAISGFDMKAFHNNPDRSFSTIATIGAWFSPN